MPSKSKLQHNFMAAIAHNPEFARKAGVKQSVGRDFITADKKAGRYAHGGTIKRRNGYSNGGRIDQMPIMATPGEYMLPVDTVKAIGKRRLDKLVTVTHKPVMRHMADGGMIETEEERSRRLRWRTPVTNPAFTNADIQGDISGNISQSGDISVYRQPRSDIPMSGTIPASSYVRPVRRMADGGTVESEDERLRRLSYAEQGTREANNLPLAGGALATAASIPAVLRPRVSSFIGAGMPVAPEPAAALLRPPASTGIQSPPGPGAFTASGGTYPTGGRQVQAEVADIAKGFRRQPISELIPAASEPAIARPPSVGGAPPVEPPVTPSATAQAAAPAVESRLTSMAKKGSRALLSAAPVIGAITAALDSPEKVKEFADSIGVDYNSFGGRIGANLLNWLRQTGDVATLGAASAFGSSASSAASGGTFFEPYKPVLATPPNPAQVAPVATAPASQPTVTGTIPSSQPIAPAIATAPAIIVPKLQSTVPYQPLRRQVEVDENGTPTGKLVVTGAGQSPEYLARMQAEGKDQAGNILSPDELARRAQANELYQPIGDRKGVMGFEQFRRLPPRAQKAYTDLMQVSSNKAQGDLSRAHIQTSFTENEGKAIDNQVKIFKQAATMKLANGQYTKNEEAGLKLMAGMKGKEYTPFVEYGETNPQTMQQEKRTWILDNSTGMKYPVATEIARTVPKGSIDRIKAAKGWSDKQVDEYLKANSLTRGM